MPELRLTRRTADEILHPTSGQVIYRDTMLSGFGVRVGAKSKTYIVEGQVKQSKVSNCGREPDFRCRCAGSVLRHRKQPSEKHALIE